MFKKFDTQLLQIKLDIENQDAKLSVYKVSEDMDHIPSGNFLPHFPWGCTSSKHTFSQSVHLIQATVTSLLYD